MAKREREWDEWEDDEQQPGDRAGWSSSAYDPAAEITRRIGQHAQQKQLDAAEARRAEQDRLLREAQAETEAALSLHAPAGREAETEPEGGSPVKMVAAAQQLLYLYLFYFNNFFFLICFCRLDYRFLNFFLIFNDLNFFWSRWWWWRWRWWGLNLLSNWNFFI